MIDSYELPHVQRVAISEPTIMVEKLVPDELPYRKYLGKMGRNAQIEGWTDSTQILDDNIRSLVDGAVKTLILPLAGSLGSIACYVTDAQTPMTAEGYDIYPYTLIIIEEADA
jgi:hypothetical protein